MKQSFRKKNSSNKSLWVTCIIFFSFLAVILTVIVLQQPQNIQQEASVLSSSTTQFGFNFSPQWTVPTLAQYQMLNPQWVRFGVVLNAKYPFVPSSVKKLVLFNNEETPTSPLGSTNIQTWKNYVDTSYVPVIKTFLAQHADTNAIEVWNEEDLGGSSVPTQAYAYMLKSAAKAIKAINPNIKVVMGGLASGNPQYIKNVKSADRNAFNQVDGVGFHPYGKSPGGWCAKNCSGGVLPFGDLATAINQYKQAGGLPVWITEIGANTTDTAWQAEYLQRIFKVFQQTGVPVAIWYAFNDGSGDWGLVDRSGNIKSSGRAFVLFNTQPTPHL